MNATLEKLEQFGIVPVVVLDDAAKMQLLSGKSSLRRRSCLCGSYIPYSCS